MQPHIPHASAFDELSTLFALLLSTLKHLGKPHRMFRGFCEMPGLHPKLWSSLADASLQPSQENSSREHAHKLSQM